MKEANGEAFINAIFAFDHYLKKQTITIKTPWKEIGEEVNISLSLDLLSLDNWTTNSSEFVKTSLEKREAKQKSLQDVSKSQSSVSEIKRR